MERYNLTAAMGYTFRLGIIILCFAPKFDEAPV